VSGSKTFRRLLWSTSIAAVCLGALLASPASAQAVTTLRGGSAHSGVLTPRVAKTKAATFWTKERMARAVPVAPPVAAAPARHLSRPAPQGPAGRVAPTAPASASSVRLAPLADPGAGAIPWGGAPFSPPAATSGKIFFTDQFGGGHSCSGSAVNTNGKNVVFTAGHCVADGGQGVFFNANPWIFVPDYNNGSEPFGEWTAVQLWTRTAWLNNRDFTEDIGAAIMATNGQGQHLVDVVGGQGFEWNFPIEEFVFDFGYPAETPFDGQVLQYCTGTMFNDGGRDGIACNMNRGSSGGPRLDAFDGTFGFLDTINSTVPFDNNGFVTQGDGPYFGNNALDLFNNVANL
jgi:hypothetical protein